MEIKSKKFIDELNSRKQGAKILSADRDFESLMAMRDRRANKYGITINEHFGDVTNPQLITKPTATTYRDDRYYVTREEFSMSHKISFTKKKKVLYSHESQRVEVVADDIDLLNSSRLPGEAYVCPNCGDLSSTEELASTGCPYCGTRFSIPQLYPKVSHFAYTEYFSELKKSGKKRAFLVALITFVIMFCIAAPIRFRVSDTTTIAIISSVFLSIIPAFIGFGISMYVHLIQVRISDHYQNAKRIQINHESNFSARVFEKAMDDYGPIFNFNYFSSRVYNLLGAMIYAENKNECPFYSGPDFIGSFDSIIDYVPIGMEIKTFNVDENGKCTIEAKVIADTYSYVRNKVLHKKAEFHIRTSKNMNYPIDINFSVHTYKCDGCSASFDVIKTANCPYCGRPHDLLDEEWYIDGAVKFFYR